jgi:hypothetical protein
MASPKIYEQVNERYYKSVKYNRSVATASIISSSIKIWGVTVHGK